MTYTPKTFALPASLQGLSEKQIKAHLGLYEGYVKHVNLVMETLKGCSAYSDKASEGDKLAAAELRRHFAFEFDGMRMHEYYFEQFEHGSVAMNAGSALAAVASTKYGSYEKLVAHIRDVAASRGVGWVVVCADTRANTMHTVFAEEHQFGQLAGLPVILALDLWEHAFMVDYLPSEKKNYLDAFFANLNWSVVEKRFDEAMKASAA